MPTMKTQTQGQHAPEACNVALAFNDLAQGGSSDKVYHINLDGAGDCWTVTAQYGRRGDSLTSTVKAKNVDYATARRAYDKKLREQLGKGYIVQGTAPAPQVAPSGVAVEIKPPELLEEVINGDHKRYVTDDAYWMQDKSDGVSRGVVKQNGEIFGINKRGLPVPLPVKLVEELSKLTFSRFQIDAELVGDKLICRDLLVADEDISALPYEVRFNALLDILFAAGLTTPFNLVSIVTTWMSHDEKVRAIAMQRERRAEGVVFKLRSAPYRAGRNGQHKKYKFIKTLSAIAGAPRANGKDSVELFLIDRSKANSPLVRCGTVSLIGKPAVKADDVVEVAYLYAQPSGLLSQARLLTVRGDVDVSECSTAQLIFKRSED